ncbi:hypothetical protein QMO81_005583 (plasmid) [Rhizobium leguminosarum]|nr:hypothetical protein [Rhizobium leguminosarum]WHO82708.1 hypothetical protein QMO81_005583 [Rhizobium leguminosarum]
MGFNTTCCVARAIGDAIVAAAASFAPNKFSHFAIIFACPRFA